MASIVSDALSSKVIVGVDTHKHIHVAVAIRGCAKTLILIGFTVGAGSDSREIWPLVPFPRSVDLAPARNPGPGSGVS